VTRECTNEIVFKEINLREKVEEHIFVKRAIFTGWNENRISQGETPAEYLLPN